MVFTTFTSNTKAKASEVNDNFGYLTFGDGSDGTFSESSGDTVLTQGSIYQYSSFTMTGTATISTTQTNGEPIIILVQGDLTISSSGTCDFAGKGVNNNDYRFLVYDSNQEYISYYGASSARRNNNPPINKCYDLMGVYQQRFFTLPKISSGQAGSNGTFLNNGGSGSYTVGQGGEGGGSLIFIVEGNVAISNVTFDLSGDNGTNGTASGYTNYKCGGGGGGAGGSCAIYYVGTYSNTGTFTITGGSGGSSECPGNIGSDYAYSGGGGASDINYGPKGLASNHSGTLGPGSSGATGRTIFKQIK
jgi:hypothetical protein